MEATPQVTPDSLVQAAPTVQAPSVIDASQVDANLKQIRSVQSAWALPELPDTVQLDLASQSGVQPQHLATFLNGLDTDLNPKKQPAQYPLAANPVTPETGGLGGDLQRIWAGLNNLRPPQTQDVDAVRIWKQDAINAGALAPPPDGMIDGSWDPSFNSIRNQMLQDQSNTRYGGDRPGAVPLSGVMKAMNDWFSPSGLLRAATDLDLVWNPGQIAKEYSSWGDKWRKLGDSSNPLDFAKNFVDAATGPIDDIVVPGVNLFLLATGVGEAYNFAKLGLAAEEGITGATAVKNIAEAPKWYDSIRSVFKASDYAADVENFKKPGFLAERLAKFDSPLINKTGSVMQAWRDLPTTQLGKKVVQTGMRLGFASQAEHSLFGSDGYALSDVAPGTKTFMQKVNENPIMSTVGEALFTPYTLFEQGSLKGLAGGAGEFLADKSGLLVPGATAAAGAAAGYAANGAAGALIGGAVGGTAGAALARKIHLQDAGFRKATNNDKITGLFYDAARANLQAKADAAQSLNETKASQTALSEFDDKFKSGGAKEALMHITGLQEEDLGANMSYVVMSAAIDHTAAVQAGDRASKGWANRYYAFRNKLVAQARQFDEADHAGAAAALARIDSPSGGERFKQAFDKYKAIAPEDMQALVSKHNQLADQTLASLLSPDNIPLDALQSYLPQVMDTFGNWSKFANQTSELQSLVRDGALTDAKWAGASGPGGGSLSVVPEFSNKNRAAGLFSADVNQPPLQHMPDDLGGVDHAPGQRSVIGQLFTDPDFSIQKWHREGITSPLATTLDPSMGRFTVMRAGTKTKQDVIELSKLVDARVQQLDAVRYLREHPEYIEQRLSRQQDMAAAMAASGAKTPEGVPVQMKLDGTDDGIMNQPLGKGSKPPSPRDRILGMLEKTPAADGTVDYSGGLAQLEMKLGDELAAMHRKIDWGGEWGLPMVKGKTEPGALTVDNILRERVKQLQSKAHWTAAQLDHESLVNGIKDPALQQRTRDFVEGLDRDGYKLVHGVEYLAPDDLARHSAQFGDWTEKHVNGATLGNFFTKGDPTRAAYNRMAMRDSIATAVSKGGQKLEPGELNHVTDELWQAVTDRQGTAQRAMEDVANSNPLSKAFTYASNSSVPYAPVDLALDDVKKLLGPVYGDDVARSVYEGLKAHRALPFGKAGLYSIEANLRSQPFLINVLKSFSGSRWAENLAPDASLGKKAAQFAVGHAGAALAGGAIGYQASGGNTLAALGGAAAGAAVGQVALDKPINKLADAWEHSDKLRYAYLPDGLARLRDRLRFSLSPFFDASRYVEGHILGNASALPDLENGERMALPFNLSPSAYKKSLRKEFIAQGNDPALAEAMVAHKFQQSVDRYKQAAKQDFDLDALEGMSRWFEGVGLLGHNPTAWQSTLHARMMDEMAKGAGASGIDELYNLNPDKANAFAKDAYERVRDIHTYGVQGRSGLEQSINFVFFPFSFQKKMMTHMAKFVAQDMSRGVMLHDAYKTYHMLDQKYDLQKFWKEHVPVMEQLSRLNNFTYGMSLGTLGGINKPFEQYALSAFTPFGGNIKNAADADHLTTLVKKMLPVYNDINVLTQDLKEQGHVVMSPSHVTSAVEAKQGYAEWNQYKKMVSDSLQARGYKYAQLGRSDALAPIRLMVKQKEAELHEKYPGWADAQVRVAGNQAALDLEKQDRLARAQSGGASLDDMSLYQFETMRKQVNDVMTSHNIDTPPEVEESLRGLALQEVDANPGFLRLYKKFYQNQLGPIERDL
jgi:hypothetical protein